MKNKSLIFAIIILVTLGIAATFLLIFSYKPNANGSPNWERMSESELYDIFYDDNYETEFDKLGLNDYERGHISVNTVDEAIEEAKGYGISKYYSTEEILDLKLESETEYYYIIYQKYISHRGTGDVTFENHYLFFKNSVLDLDTNIIGEKYRNDSKAVKEILDTYIYIGSAQNLSSKPLSSSIEEKSNRFDYECYSFDASYGDWGLRDSISLIKDTYSIDKQSGQFIRYTPKTIKSFGGKVNSLPRP